MLAMLARLRWSTRIPADQLRRGLAEAPIDVCGAEADNFGNLGSMATTLRDVRPPALTETPQAPPNASARRPFRDNPRLILLGILILLVALVAMVTLADRAPDFNPNFLTEVLLYALSVADLTMLLALGFVLARNIVKLLVERRLGLPFFRFRAKLVGAMLGLTIIPALLVLLVGSELIRSSMQRWVSQPADSLLTSARQIAHEYYREREDEVVQHAGAIARALPPALVRDGAADSIARTIAGHASSAPGRTVEVYGCRPSQRRCSSLPSSLRRAGPSRTLPASSSPRA